MQCVHDDQHKPWSCRTTRTKYEKKAEAWTAKTHGACRQRTGSAIGGFTARPFMLLFTHIVWRACVFSSLGVKTRKARLEGLVIAPSNCSYNGGEFFGLS
jgi:hypothetical protein